MRPGNLRFHMKLLFVYLSVAGVNCAKQQSRLRNLYVFLLVTFHILSLVYCSSGYGRFGYSVEDVEEEAAILALAMGCISIIISTNFYGASAFQERLAFFDSLTGSSKQLHKSLWTLLIAHRLELMVIIAIDLHFWLNQNEIDIKFHYGLYAQLLMFDTGRLLMCWISIEFSSRFKVLKKQLKESFTNKEQFKILKIVLPTSDNHCYLHKIKKISYLHNKLCDELQMVNKSCGWIMLFDILISIGYLLRVFSLMISYSLSKHPQKIFYAVWAIDYSVSIVFLFQILFLSVKRLLSFQRTLENLSESE